MITHEDILSHEEELRLQELLDNWRFADQPHPTYEQLYQAVLEERNAH